jgi:hypothetical protein
MRRAPYPLTFGIRAALQLASECCHTQQALSGIGTRRLGASDGNVDGDVRGGDVERVCPDRCPRMSAREGLSYRAHFFIWGASPRQPPYTLSRALLRRALQSRGLTRFARSLLIQRASPVSQRL